ncbi:YncE family protein [Ancylobacter sp. A5.8]|uniref:YncE family protein n=1 Tax=Ancylobacter gelatini TaxID=2919920 RepID=UPI001F4D4FDF|nr:YncE family protein [Ancylobacter gelatini]MCJ8141787.1 YncE family protein [Ancylobacter gelatini]
MDARARRLALVSGRWDPMLTVVDIDAALDPANNDTDRAVITRARVTPDIALPSGARAPAVGLPVSVAAVPALDRLVVVNHAGCATPQALEAHPHGHAGALAMFDLRATLAGSATRPTLLLPTATFGPVGCVVAPDGRHLLVAAGEGPGLEDGGYQISVIDLPTCTLRHNFALPHEGEPTRAGSPDPGFGRYPNPAGIAIARGSPDLVLTADGGSSTVTAIALADVLSGEPRAPLARLELPTGPFGIAASPDGTLAVVAGRECPRTGAEGNAVTFLDLAALRRGDGWAARHVVVGSDDGRPSRPMGVAFSPDGLSVFATCFRTGTVSRIERTAQGDWKESGRAALCDPLGSPPCPRGIGVTGDGALVVVAGGARGAPGSSQLWLLDARTLRMLARVSGVGNETYFIEVIEISSTASQ